MLRSFFILYLIITTTGTVFWFLGDPKEEEVLSESNKMPAFQPATQKASSRSADSTQHNQPTAQQKRSKWSVFSPSLRLPYLQRSNIRIDPNLPALDLVNKLVEATGLPQKVEGIYSQPVRAFYIDGDQFILDLQPGYAELMKDSNLASIQNLYALVNTILENVTQDKVLLLFQGNPPSGKLAELDLSQELFFNPTIVEPGSKSET